MIESSCFAEQFAWRLLAPRNELVDCNCSICRRYAALWAYYSLKDVIVPAGLTDTFMLGPKKIEFHRCKICGCVTHWSPTDQRVIVWA